jgi:hypothetical protein
MMVYFPQEKIILLRKEIQSLLDNCFPKIRQVARVTGLIVSTFPAVYPDPLHKGVVYINQASVAF